jgi:hypothetical protein
MTNPHETAARLQKVLTIVTLAQRHGLTAEQVERMEDSHWYRLEQAARVNRCSETTRKMIIATMRAADQRPAPEVK